MQSDPRFRQTPSHCGRPPSGLMKTAASSPASRRSSTTTYLFKHALVQDAAYGTLLREPRRALHAHIAEALENQFIEIAESPPELLARHCTEAGLIEKAATCGAKRVAGTPTGATCGANLSMGGMTVVLR